MRRLHGRNMIGSMLFYAFYPLSRYLASRLSEAKKDPRPAVVNGTTLWDGGSVTTRAPSQSQTTSVDQCLRPSSGTMGEAEERMKKMRREGEDDLRSDQLMAVLPEESKAASKTSEMQAAVQEKETETVNAPQHDTVEGPEQDKGDNPHEVFCMKQNAEGGCVIPTESVDPEQELRPQVECLQIVDSAETTHLVHEDIKLLDLEESETPAEPSIQKNISSAQKQVQTQSVEESLTPSKTTAEGTECWDEYADPTVKEMLDGDISELEFSSFLGNTRILGREHDTRTGWHFPAGPGLAEEVHCPLWQFPACSYYPQMRQTDSIEVMWRVWVWEERDKSASAAEPGPFTKASMAFTVMSYNILAADLMEANQELYTHCPLEVLDWSYRCRLLLEEILKWAPDILCLQEVQENHYHEDLYPVLSQMGYTCVYKRRTGTKTDGCATCYRSSCFSEVSVTLLEYFRPEMELLDRHNVGIVLLLRPVVTRGSDVKAMGPPLCVANTHLLFNPRRGDVKLAQLAIMLAEIDRVTTSCRAQGEHCNLIVCGDFNAVPHMPLYQLITTGQLDFQGLPGWMISGQEDLSYNTFSHQLSAALWPSCLTYTCQHTTDETFQSQKPGKCQYSHDFLLQLRFSPAACVRPLDLELIPGVTDGTPEASKRNHQLYEKRFSHTLCHRLDLESVYKHILPGSGSPEVTTLHSAAGATVDYIFYTPRRILTADQKACGELMSEGLKLIGSLSLPSEDVLWSLKGLPNDIFPSDHLSLVAKFQMDLNVA